jgi:NADH-quinone oxidoreductase subunit A
MSASLLQFAPIAVLLCMAIAFVSVTLFLPKLAGKKSFTTPVKDSPYECGMPSEIGTQGTFGVKFYLVAMIFIVFDLEVVFILGWATSFRDLVKPVSEQGLGTLAFWAMVVFVGILEVGHFYLWKKGALTWGRFTALRRTDVKPHPAALISGGPNSTVNRPATISPVASGKV